MRIENVILMAAHINEADTWMVDVQDYIKKHRMEMFGRKYSARHNQYIQAIKKARAANKELVDMFIQDGHEEDLTDVSSVLTDLLLNCARNPEQKEAFINHMMDFKFAESK